MENFNLLEKCDVWPHLQAGKEVYAVILRSRNFTEGIKELWHDGWTIKQINCLLSDKEKNVVFYEEVTECK